MNLANSPSRNVAKWISSSLSPAQDLAENKASSPASSKPPGIPTMLMLYRVPEKQGKRKKKGKKAARLLPWGWRSPGALRWRGKTPVLHTHCILPAFALQSDDTISCPGRSPNPSEQTSGPMAGFYKAPTAGSLPPQKPSARATRGVPRRKANGLLAGP